MTRGAMSCNWIFMMALATGIPGSRRRCFANCSVLLPRAPSLIDTFEAASLMPNYRLRTKRHWASACAGLQSRLRGAQEPVVGAEDPPQVEPAPRLVTVFYEPHQGCTSPPDPAVDRRQSRGWGTHKWKFSPAINEP